MGQIVDAVLHRVGNASQQPRVFLGFLLGIFLQLLGGLLGSGVGGGQRFLVGGINVVRQPHAYGHHQEQSQSEGGQLGTEFLQVDFHQRALSLENRYGEQHAGHGNKNAEGEEPQSGEQEFLQVNDGKDDHEVGAEVH